jgi:mannose/fructose/N-acetylgalactosamine-specific phosphotransferase system component IIC
VAHRTPDFEDAPVARPVRPFDLFRLIGPVLAALLVGAIAGAMTLGLCFGLSSELGWTPGFALGSEIASALAALAVGGWMLRQALAVERAEPERAGGPVR